jgi:hypothetical protein
MRTSVSNNPEADPFNGDLPSKTMSTQNIVPAKEQLSDEEAMTHIASEILNKAHEEWLKDQFVRRTPWPSRVKIEGLEKEGHPMMFPPRIFGLMKVIADHPYTNEKSFQDDLAFFKIDFAVYFGVEPSYFDYLDTLTPEEFRTWLSGALNSIYFGNAHWVTFVNRLLSVHSIDFSDLVQGLLSPTDQNIVNDLYLQIKAINEAKTAEDLNLLLAGAEGLGILDEMINVHRSWRKNRHGLSEVANDTETRFVLARSTPEHMINAMRSSVNMVIENNPEFTSTDLMLAIEEVKARYDSDPTIPAEVTFAFMLQIIKILEQIEADYKDSEDKANEIHQATQIMVNNVAMDANPSPMKTVIDMQGRAIQMRQNEA